MCGWNLYLTVNFYGEAEVYCPKCDATRMYAFLTADGPLFPVDAVDAVDPLVDKSINTDGKPTVMGKWTRF